MRQRVMLLLAWLLIVGSIAVLVLMLVMRRHAVDAGTSCVFGWSDANGRHVGGWALTYEGRAGFYLAGAELGVVLLATIASLMRHDLARRTGLLVLIAWSLVWLAGATRQLIGVPAVDSAAYTLATLVVTVATLVRAHVAWNHAAR